MEEAFKSEKFKEISISTSDGISLKFHRFFVCHYFPEMYSRALQGLEISVNEESHVVAEALSFLYTGDLSKLYLDSRTFLERYNVELPQIGFVQVERFMIGASTLNILKNNQYVNTKDCHDIVLVSNGMASSLFNLKILLFPYY